MIRRTRLTRSTKPIRRSPLRPSLTPIPRRTELARSRKRIRTRRLDPTKRAWAKHRCPALLAWIREQACLVSGRPVDPAHVVPRSRGGDDRNNTVPLSRAMHEEQHRIGIPAFEAKYARALRGKSLAEWAVIYTERWDEERRPTQYHGGGSGDPRRV